MLASLLDMDRDLAAGDVYKVQVSLDLPWSGLWTVDLKEQPYNKQRSLKIVNNCLNTNIYSYIETSGGHSQNLYLNVVHF